MEGSESKPSSSVYNLLCREDKSVLNEEDAQKMGTQFLNSQVVPYYYNDLEYEDEYIQMLVQKERFYFANSFGSSSNYPSWLKSARSRAIHWILNTQNSFGFQNQTIYLSIVYLDRFLSRRYIYEHQSWAAILLSVACVSVAAKMEENKVPALAAYKVEDFECNCSVIQHMELIVLTTLEWQMNLITPFVYFNYFVRQLGFQETKDDLISRANELVMGLIEESKSIEDYPPFVAAAAAVMAASDWQLTKEALKLKISTVSLWEVSDNQKEQQEEQLISCYSIMQRLCAKYYPSTPNVTEVEQQEEGPSTNRAGRKRKLSFRDSDPKPDSPDDHDRT